MLFWVQDRCIAPLKELYLRGNPNAPDMKRKRPLAPEAKQAAVRIAKADAGSGSGGGSGGGNVSTGTVKATAENESK